MAGFMGGMAYMYESQHCGDAPILVLQCNLLTCSLIRIHYKYNLRTLCPLKTAHDNQINLNQTKE